MVYSIRNSSKANPGSIFSVLNRMWKHEASSAHPFKNDKNSEVGDMFVALCVGDLSLPIYFTLNSQFSLGS